MEIDGFDWDEGNVRKNLIKHSVAVEEVEELFFNQPLFIFDDPKHSFSEKRQIAFGRTVPGRLLTIAFTLRKIRNGLYLRPISARPMHRKERVLYEKAVTQVEK